MHVIRCTQLWLCTTLYNGAVEQMLAVQLLHRIGYFASSQAYTVMNAWKVAIQYQFFYIVSRSEHEHINSLEMALITVTKNTKTKKVGTAHHQISATDNGQLWERQSPK